MDNKQWFREAGFGMMIHWGLYSLPAGEWKGRRMSDIGEWAQEYFRIPMAEYSKLAGIFNPILFDAEEWVKLAEDAGMKYMVFTAKHHEGFAMFKSEVSKYNIVDATPFGRDVTAELAEACYKHGMKFGLYYSQDLDWSEPDGGGYTSGKTWCGGKAYWTNNWDFPDDEQALACGDEYLLGRRLLVAPIVQPGAEGRKVYLPKGRWKHFFTGKVYEGGRTVELSCPLNEALVFEREEEETWNCAI